MKDPLKITGVCLGVAAGWMLGEIFFTKDCAGIELFDFMQSQKAACESELSAGHECVLVFEYVVVEK